ncbi:MAG TPA: RNA polymerase sigma-70 factor [Candidatus Brocadiaceae bacterium]
MSNASQYDEKALLERVAVGDRKAFTDLYSNHVNGLYRFIYLFTKSKEETEEILQDVFVRIWEKKERLAEVQSFKNYLFKAAKNKLISHVRHLQIKDRVLSEIRRSRSNSSETTYDQVDYKEYYDIVQRAIDKLPPKRKLIFRLNTENGLSQDEIADKLKVSKSFVQKQLYKAYDFVRQYLSKHGQLYFPLIVFLASFVS